MEKEKKEKSFEDNLEELGQIVTKLEAGDIPLDDAIKEFERAMQLAKTCDGKLKNAEKAIHKLVDETDTVKDFEVEE